MTTHQTRTSTAAPTPTAPARARARVQPFCSFQGGHLTDDDSGSHDVRRPRADRGRRTGRAGRCLRVGRHGVVPVLIETLTEPTQQSRAVGVQPRSQEMFSVLGMLDEILERSLPQHAIEIHSGSTRIPSCTSTPPTSAPRTRPSSTCRRPRWRASCVLVAADLGVRIRRGVTLTALTQDAEGVDVTLHTTAETSPRGSSGCSARTAVTAPSASCRERTARRFPWQPLRDGRRPSGFSVRSRCHPAVLLGRRPHGHAVHARQPHPADVPGSRPRSGRGAPTLGGGATTRHRADGRPVRLQRRRRSPTTPSTTPRCRSTGNRALSRGRRRSHPQPRSRPRHEHRDARRRQPGLEARARLPRSGRHSHLGLLPRRTASRRRRGRPAGHPDGKRDDVHRHPTGDQRRHDGCRRPHRPRHPCPGRESR